MEGVRPCGWKRDGPQMAIVPVDFADSTGPRLASEVTVQNPVASLTSVALLVRFPDDWIEDHRNRLDLARTYMGQHNP